MTQPSNAEALYRAQCARDGFTPQRFESLRPRTRAKFERAAVSCRGPRLEPWHGDHTDLVHVLWGHGVKGQAADDLATSIRSSVYDDARRAHDQIAALDRLADLIASGTGAEAAITTLKNTLIGADQ